jgi:hypothetical protein
VSEFEEELNMINTELQNTEFGSRPAHSNGGNVAGRKTAAANADTDSWVELKYRNTGNLATAKMAKGLGLFSIALGLAEVLMPAQTATIAGLNNKQRSFLPALGLREIASGIGIMKSAKPTAAVWSRVAGDAVDLAFLGMAFAADDSNKRRLIGSTLAVLGVTAMDVLCAQKLSSQNWAAEQGNPAAPTTVGQTSGRLAYSA